MPALAFATVSSSRSPPSCMINATSPAAKSSPINTEASNARDTSTSALISSSVTSPITASRMIGIPQRIIATHDASNGSFTKSKMLHNRAIPEIIRNVMSFFVPPISISSSCFLIKFFIFPPPNTYVGIGLLYV